MPNDLCGFGDAIEGRPLASSVYGLLSRYFSGGHRQGSRWVARLPQVPFEAALFPSVPIGMRVARIGLSRSCRVALVC